MKNIISNIIKVANKIHRDSSSCSANCVIIERTNPHYDEMVKILKKRK